MVGMRGSWREGRASGPGATLLLALVASVLLAVGPSEARKSRKVPRKGTATKTNAHRAPLAGGGRASMVEEFMEFVPRLQASPARVVMMATADQYLLLRICHVSPADWRE